MADRIEIRHPGVILLEEFLKPLGISQNRLARAMHVPSGRINEIVKAKRSISAETSLLLGKALGMSEKFWLNLQVDYDFRIARRAFEDKGELDIMSVISTSAVS